LITDGNESMTAKEREHAFMVAAPLAIIPALAFLPAVMFLVVAPQVAHGRLIGALAIPACALVSIVGLWKLAMGAVQRPWGIFNVLNVGALFVLLVIAGYTGMFLAWITLKL